MLTPPPSCLAFAYVCWMHFDKRIMKQKQGGSKHEKKFLHHPLLVIALVAFQSVPLAHAEPVTLTVMAIAGLVAVFSAGSIDMIASDHDSARAKAERPSAGRHAFQERGTQLRNRGRGFRCRRTLTGVSSLNHGGRPQVPAINDPRRDHGISKGKAVRSALPLFVEATVFTAASQISRQVITCSFRLGQAWAARMAALSLTSKVRTSARTPLNDGQPPAVIRTDFGLEPFHLSAEPSTWPGLGHCPYIPKDILNR